MAQQLMYACVLRFRTMQEVAELSPTGGRQPGVTSLYLSQSASVLVVDVVLAVDYINSSPTASDMSAVLNAAFATIDNVIKTCGCEKVGTVGCRYLAIAGLYTTSTGERDFRQRGYLADHSMRPNYWLVVWFALADHAYQAAECCLAVQIAMSRFCQQQRLVQVDGARAGIHSGDVVFGVLGVGPAPGRFDIFGETVSVAVRMAECAPTSSIIVSKSTHGRIQSDFFTERKGVASLKRSRDGVEIFFLKAKSSGQLGARNQRSNSAQIHTRSFSISSLDVTADVQAGCAFPGPTDESELAFLQPSTDEVAATLQASSGHFGDVSSTQSDARSSAAVSRLSWDQGLEPFSRRRCCRWSFKQAYWEQDFRVNEVVSRRKNQTRTLSCLLVVLSVSFWMLEKYTASVLPPSSSQASDRHNAVDDEDFVFVWVQYVLLCLPTCLLLGFVFSKSYRRAPSLLTAIACLASGVAFAAVIELNYGLPRGEAVAMFWLATVAHGYFGCYMSPAVAIVTNVVNSGLMMATLQSCSMAQPRWMCTHMWTVLLLSLPVHGSGIDAGVAYDRSRRLRYAWWSYYAAIAPEFNDHDDGQLGDLSGAGHLSKSGQLLSLLVPPHVAARALAEGSAVTEDYDGAVLAAVDLAGFSQIAQKQVDGDADRVEALAFIRDAFCVAEILAQKYQVRLLRRAGTSFLVGTGPLSRCQPQATSEQLVEGVADAERLALFGLELIENVRVWGVERWGAQLCSELGAGVRVGISTGRASTGLVGSLRFGYDVWSSGVVLANRLESHATLNTCCTSAEVRAALRRASTAYRFDDPGSRPMMVQGLGSLRTYTLVEYVPAAAEGARLSLSVATPSGIEFGLSTPTPAPRDEEMLPTTVETLDPVRAAPRDQFSESESESESEGTDEEQGETTPASYVFPAAAPPVRHEATEMAPSGLFMQPVPPAHQPPSEFGRRRQPGISSVPAPPQAPPRSAAAAAAAATSEQQEVRAATGGRPQRRIVIG